MATDFPFFKQHDQMDCGPTCLQMIAKHYGRYYSLNDLRRKSFITREGVSLLGISDAAEAIGFRTIGVKIPFEKFESDAILPCIIHWNQKHFIIVYRIKRDKVFVADPAIGLISYSKEEFKKSWLATSQNGNDLGIALFLDPQPSFYEIESQEDNLKRKNLIYLFGYIRNNQRLVVQLIIGLFAGSLIQLSLPFLTQVIVDVGINTHNIQFIYLVLAGQMMLFISRTAVDFIRRWILLHLGTRINISIISDFLSKLYKLPLTFFEGKMIGDILRRIEDHSRIEKFLSSTSLNILFSFFNLIIFGFVLLLYNIPIFIVFASFSLIYIGFVIMFLKRRYELDYKRFQQAADNQSNLIQTVQGISEIKMNNCETRKRWEWERIQAKLFRINVQSTSLLQFQDAGSLFLNESKNMLITVMAALAVLDGTLTLGMMLSIQYIIGQLNAPINDLITFTRDWQDAKISLERIGEIHLIEDEEDHTRVMASDQSEFGTIVLKDVSFHYDGPHAPNVLDKIDLIIPQGKVTAIVGTSGSGKTTLLKVLLKFYKPTDGKIRIGNEDLEFIHSRTLRKNCGVVMQDGFLFSDTIANNISLSDEVADRGRLFNSVRVANIQEFIESLPLGFSTKIGMNGIGLSQGQKQRLLIARAVYKDPQIIFFDEATSALDANNEREIMKNLDVFFRNKTVVVIAHRLSTVKNADQIVVLEKGKIVETGTHLELTSKRGKYFELVKNQLELGS